MDVEDSAPTIWRSIQVLRLSLSVNFVRNKNIQLKKERERYFHKRYLQFAHSIAFLSFEDACDPVLHYSNETIYYFMSYGWSHHYCEEYVRFISLLSVIFDPWALELEHRNALYF